MQVKGCQRMQTLRVTREYAKNKGKAQPRVIASGELPPDMKKERGLVVRESPLKRSLIRPLKY